MNERIREFARTSHLDVYGLGKDRAKWEDTLEKFAELIVRECCLLTEQYQHRVTFYRADETIKRHFGVEE